MGEQFTLLDALIYIGIDRIVVVTSRFKVAALVHSHRRTDAGDPGHIQLQAIDQRHKNLAAEPVQQDEQEIHQAVGQHHTDPVSRQLHGHQSRAQIKNVLQAGGTQGQQRRLGNDRGHQQSGNAIHQHIGNQGEEQRRHQMGPKIAVPGHGHGVERIAHPRCQQIPPQGLGHKEGVEAIDQSHLPCPLGEHDHQAGIDPVLIFPASAQKHEHQHRKHQAVASPQGRIAGNIRPQDRLVTEGDLQLHGPHLPVHK